MSAFRIFHFMHCFLLLSIFNLEIHGQSVQRELNINLDTVHEWADQFTADLLELADIGAGAGCLEDFMATYPGEVLVDENKISETLTQVRQELEAMLKDKEKGVEKLVKAAEAANREYGAYKKPEQLDPEEIAYYNAKKLVSDDNVRDLTNETKEVIKQTIHYLKVDNTYEDFNYNSVNLTVSTIHVPTNIYDKSVKILNGVSWSENMTKQFTENLKEDPSLTWQYFCSSDGFFRIYPGIIWPRDPDKVDMFDCRVRNWYIQAATTPKNIAILMDVSGSMKGMRMEIARKTVDKILDTLSNDDYFNILQFSDEVLYVDECFNRTMMQASVDNRRRMQDELENVKTAKMANFENALVEAFMLFETVEQDLKRILCNKAIMLVTDGAPENYEEVFEEYNWPNKTVRVFTYLIGKEVSDNRQVKWMACANKGDHKHISTRADVQENVQQYIKVMSRPMVQERYHNLIWTAAYLDYATEQSDIIEQLENPFSPHTDMLGTNKGDFNKGLGLMITVAMPVFDSRESTGEDEERPDGNLLGVAGTDVRTFELKKYIPLHKLGVNGYAFAITNHGYIIFHPDFRPLYRREIGSSEMFLKPNYNSVDMTEVELADNASSIQELRQGMLDHNYASMEILVTEHDDMKRYRKRTNLYYFDKVSEIFSLALVIPKGYGEIRLRPQYNLLHTQAEAEYLNNETLLLAPWIFCKNATSGQMQTLRKYQLQDIVNGTATHQLKCDPDLVRLLVYDAIQTYNYTKIWEGQKDYLGRGRLRPGSNIKKDYRSCYGIADQKDMKKCYTKVHAKYGIDFIFIGTSVGLTRFLQVEEAENLTEFDFASSSTKTIGEPYYKRAVSGWQDGYNYTFALRKSGMFPMQSTTVIMSSPEVLKRGGKEAVAAVVGFQMKHYKFSEMFHNITTECPSGSCDFTCNDTEYLNCYLLDHSGFVMASNNKDGNDTGKFFGMVDNSLLEELIRENIYNTANITDYQGMCKIYASDQESAAPLLTNPLSKIFSWLMWTIAESVIFLSEWSFYSLLNSVNYVRGGDFEDMKDIADPDLQFYIGLMVRPETQERPNVDYVVDFEACDKTVRLYALNVSTFHKVNRNGLTKSITSCGCSRMSHNRTYIVRWIRDTNMILVVAAANCSCGEGDETSITPEKIKYILYVVCLWAFWVSIVPSTQCLL
ncbi:voltage-dependent calcium channel subunit alpha-2/delta-3-like [Haliotis cracherodii]|uniref:voltage-dependent calcium channel subunit alpha-2/delta-3-like n=1 Tax=Haliotis cracherodii TaxID=6455 RepID=UPI0039E78719